MIRYALACDQAHAFEGWFGSSADFDDQQARGLLECPMCGSKAVRKAIMAPAIAGTKSRSQNNSPAETHQLVELIRTLPPELGVLMIEHDMEVVFSLADRVTVLYYGEVLASGAPDEVANDERVREVYLGASI